MGDGCQAISLFMIEKCNMSEFKPRSSPAVGEQSQMKEEELQRGSRKKEMSDRKGLPL